MTCKDCPWNDALLCDLKGYLIIDDDLACEEGLKYMNQSGCKDPTAEMAVGRVSKKKKKTDKIGDMRKVFDHIAGMMGYEIVGRIIFRSKKTGDEYH